MTRPLLLLALAGCAADPALECDGHASSRPEHLWCAAHRDIVLRFVKSTSDVDGRRARLEWFRSTFYVGIAKLPTEDAVLERVASIEKEMPGFARLFQQEHLWAVRDGGELNPDLRLPLMMAGFRHAVVQLDRELNPRQGVR